MNRPNVVLLNLVVVTLVSAVASAGVRVSAKCLEVIDGDTFIVDISGTRVEVEVALVDSPELDQPFGQEAKDFTTEMVLGKDVTIDGDLTLQGGVISRQLRVGGVELERKLLEAGLAWHDPNRDCQQSLIDLEVAAREAGIGLWSDEEPVPPWEWRARPAPTEESVQEDGPVADSN